MKCNPEWFQSEFTSAICKKDLGAIRRLRQKLVLVEPRWAHELYRLIRVGKLHTDDVVCAEYCAMLAANNRAHEIVDRTIEVCAGHLPSYDMVSGVCIVTIVFLSRFPQLVPGIVERAMNDRELCTNFKIILIRVQRDGIEVQVGDSALFTADMALTSLEKQAMLRLIVPFKYLSWTGKLVAQATAEATAMNVATRNDVPVVTDDMCADIWQQIVRDARYTLHTDGDRIDFHLPRLEQANVRSAVLRPNGRFPNANIDLILGNADAVGILEAKLESGRLTGIDHMWTDAFRAYVGYIISVGYLHIVNGGLYEDQHCRDGCRGGNGSVRYRRVARPHPLKLRPRFKPSQDAISKCVERLGRAPLPGYTFRVPIKGAVVGDQRGTIKLTPDIIEKYAV